MSMGRRVGVNSVWLIAQPLFLNVVTLLAMGYITRQLGKSGYGVFNDGFAIVALYAPLANLGLRTVVVRDLAEQRADAARVFGAYLALRLGLALLVAGLVAAYFAWRPPGMQRGVVVMLAALSMLLQVLTQSLGDRFRASERMRPVAVAEMAGGLSLTALSVLALALDFGLVGFTVAYVLGTGIGLAVITRSYLPAFGWPRPNLDRALMRGQLRQARPFIVMQWVAGVTDRPVIDIRLLMETAGAAVTGSYSAVALLVNRLGVIPQGVTGALFPAVAAGYAERRAEVEQTVRGAMLYLAIATVPLAVAVSFVAGPVVRLVFGAEYASAAPALAILIWVVPLLGPNLLMYDCLAAVRRQNVAAAITLAGGIGLIALYALLIPRFGAVGAAASLVAKEALLFVVLLREMRRSFTEPVPLGQLGKAGLALGLMAAPLALVATSTSLLLQLGAVAGGAGLYALALFRLRVLRLTALRDWLSAARAS